MRLVRCAGGRQDAQTLLTRVWERRQRRMRNLAWRLLLEAGQDRDQAVWLLRVRPNPEAKELIASAGGIKAAVALLRRIAAEEFNSAADACPEPASVLSIPIDDESDDPPGTH